MSADKSATTRVVERMADLLIQWRKGLLALFVLLTVALGYSATHTQLDPGFNKQIPVRNAFMVNFLNFSQYFTGANRFLVSVKWKGEGDIYNAEYLNTLRKVTDDVFFIMASAAPVWRRCSPPMCVISKSPKRAFSVMWWCRHASQVPVKI